MSAAEKPYPRTLYEIRGEMAILASRNGDTEIDHLRADDLLIEAIRLFASLFPPPASKLWTVETEELISSFKRLGKWYA